MGVTHTRSGYLYWLCEIYIIVSFVGLVVNSKIPSQRGGILLDEGVIIYIYIYIYIYMEVYRGE